MPTEKFKNKYRTSSHRKPDWDYSADALYFLTIVTQQRECNMGTIAHTHEMLLSDFGKIVEFEWFRSFEIRQELVLHDFVLMPNHLHTIVEICNKNRDGAERGGAERDGADVETHGRVSLRFPQSSSILSPQLPSIFTAMNGAEIDIKRNPPIRLPKSISSFIAGFKSSVNTKIDDYIDEHKLSLPKYNRNNHFFQPNYHDHIIRNYTEYQNIQNYIINNPKNWNKDKFYR